MGVKFPSVGGALITMFVSAAICVAWAVVTYPALFFFVPCIEWRMPWSMRSTR